MKTDTTYNGYTNYETWNVMLWLYNEEHLYNELRSMLRPYKGCGIGVGDVWAQIRRLIIGDFDLNSPK